MPPPVMRHHRLSLAGEAGRFIVSAVDVSWPGEDGRPALKSAGQRSPRDGLPLSREEPQRLWRSRARSRLRREAPCDPGRRSTRGGAPRRRASSPCGDCARVARRAARIGSI